MSSEVILKSLNSCKDHKADIEEKIEELEKQLDYLYEFRNKYRSCKENFNYNMNHRKQNLEMVKSLGSRANIANSYYLKMNELINGNRFNNIANKVEDIEIEVAKKVAAVESEINELKQEVQNYDGQISNLYYDLSRVDKQ